MKNQGRASMEMNQYCPIEDSEKSHFINMSQNRGSLSDSKERWMKEEKYYNKVYDYEMISL
jgi:hypothetical protein